MVHRGLGVMAVCVAWLGAAAVSGQTVLYSTGSILHRSNLGTTPGVRSTGPYTDCRVEYNGDNALNPDDLGDFITDYFTFAPIAGPGGYATPCPSEPIPYDNGYKCNYTSDGSAQCSPPFPDNLGDYITDYFAGCTPLPVISPLPNYTSAGAAFPPLQLPLGAMIVSPGGPNTTAKAGLGTLSTPSALGIVFATGTSLTQAKNPSLLSSTASTLTISFEAAWELTSTLGPTAVAGAGLTLLGSLPPNPVPMGGCPVGAQFARMDLAAEFYYSIPAGASGFMRPSIASSPFGSIVTSCGPYSITASDNVLASPTSFPAGTTITITGTLTLSLHNDPLGEARIDEITASDPGQGPTIFTLKFLPPPPAHPADFNHDGVVNNLDSQQFHTAFSNQTPGPGGYAVPCPGAPPPFNQGFRADFNGDCALTPNDFSGFYAAFDAAFCPADFNRDGVVNNMDSQQFQNALFSLTPGPGGYSHRCPLTPGFPGFQADFNGDCAASLIDLAAFQQAFNTPCGPTFCPADFNRDGLVNAMDLSLFQNAFDNLTPGPGGFSDRCPVTPGFQADFNGDCVVTQQDRDAFLMAYNNGC
ncbi:MAG: dockerin type I domain-containing protein [Phycisphaerales bacterium]